MDDRETQLLALQGLLETATEQVSRMLHGLPMSEEDKRIVAAAAMHTARHQPRTRADVLRFTEAIHAGDDGWLILRSVPGEQRTEAVYFTTLPPELRKLTGM